MKPKYVLALVLALILAGCTAPQTGGEGKFELLVSDAPAAIDDFDSLEVSFSEARVFKGEGGNESFESIDIEGRTVDLTQVKGARAKSLLNTTLETGTYTKIELHASDNRGIVNGEEVAVKIPPGKLMITKDFEIKPDKTTEFVFDIQVVLRGNQRNNQGYILKPVISKSGVVGKDVERKSGKGDKGGKEDKKTPPRSQGKPEGV
ncbi:MAG: DUF4382 domain-containing protein [Candidatus Nanohaloarchaea archaeon]|nr:DUF4382 domain-containing protein [Candidatus Nanohaloarchaea archaeon]